ncbi:MAG: DUF362 domain-containing protein [Anaerolineae bacterium]
MKSTVSLIRGDSRYDNVAKALDLIAHQIDLSHKRKVLIKPNFVSTRRQLAATHVDAVRAVLDFLRERYHGPITIGEGPAASDAFEGYTNYGYQSLVEEYGVDLINLNAAPWQTVQVYDRKLRPLKLRLAKPVLESDYRISLALPKTHDTVVVTLSLKNMIMGSLISEYGNSRGPGFLSLARELIPARIQRSLLFDSLKIRILIRLGKTDKFAMHQGFPVINLNLYTLARLIPPHLSVIDGYEGMEGAGPVDGEPVPWGIALASTDFLAVDTVTAHLMGYPLEEVGYLYYCRQAGLGTGHLTDIEIVGNAALTESTKSFRPHPTYRQQLAWQMSGVEQYL